MTTTKWALLTAGITVLIVSVLQFASRLNARSASLAARRRTGIMQLTRWGVLAAGVTALAGEGAVAFGVSSAWTGGAALAFVSCCALAVREPLGDFLAAASFIVERTAAVGDEVELNGEVSGTLVGFGLRSVAVQTWDGDVVYHTASAITTFRNSSKAASRATVDIEIPANVRVARATSVLEAVCRGAFDSTFRSQPEVLGVIDQQLEHYTVRVSCFVDPARNRHAQYRLKAAAVDAVAELIDGEGIVRNTAQVLAIVGQTKPVPDAFAADPVWADTVPSHR
ncbi:MAG: Small-conductance mechanosensitive channel [Ilumatobacteraceae bacterium]|nr:Small-conductance mechanosensitive channel [Ilumatobacteraceae bacterium]